jgi:hypothetical protein
MPLVKPAGSQGLLRAPSPTGKTYSIKGEADFFNALLATRSGSLESIHGIKDRIPTIGRSEPRHRGTSSRVGHPGLGPAHGHQIPERMFRFLVGSPSWRGKWESGPMYLGTRSPALRLSRVNLHYNISSASSPAGPLPKETTPDRRLDTPKPP